MSGFEILTITFSFIVGLGVAQVLRSVAFVVREKGQVRLHWIPFWVAAMVLFFQVQFWFGLAVINSLQDQWTWGVYGLMLMLAIFIFLSGATALPPVTSVGERDLIGKLNRLFSYSRHILTPDLPYVTKNFAADVRFFCLFVRHQSF